MKNLFLPLWTISKYLLPAALRSDDAAVMIHAICNQESRWLHRRQFGGGPARGYPQFELGLTSSNVAVGGISLLMKHPSAGPLFTEVLRTLNYKDATPTAVWTALEHNDVLALCAARCLLWTLPGALPSSREQTQLGWDQYYSAWRPGAPKRDTWDDFYHEAFDTVKG